MDPDPEAEQAASKMIQTTIITVVFTACHGFQTETSTAVSALQFTLPDSSSGKTVHTRVPEKKKQKTLYLTFDDGPNKGTRKVMRIARQQQVPVTMFIIGEHIYGSKEQSATYDSLQLCDFVELQNHSFTHAGNGYENFYSEPGKVVQDFIRCNDSLMAGHRVVRTPGRNIWRTETISSTDIEQSKPAADSLQKAGFTVIGWDLEWPYNRQLCLVRSSEELLQQVDSLFAHGKTKIPGHLVLLAHDQVYADSADSLSLDNFVKQLKRSDEYDFELISNYPGLKN